MNDTLLAQKELCEKLNLYLSFKRYDLVYTFITTGNLGLNMKSEEYKQSMIDTLILFNELIKEDRYNELFYLIENPSLISKYVKVSNS